MGLAAWRLGESLNDVDAATFHPGSERPAMSARVFGTVKDAATGTTITTALVVAPPYTVTCSNGSYTFNTPGAATVTVTASDANYVSHNTTVSVTNGQNKLLNFSLVHV
jgi:hypothetical protein